MPYTMRKVKNKSCYRVVNKKTGQVKARCSTKKNAKKQMLLLRALENNPKFRKSLRRKRRSGGGEVEDAASSKFDQIIVIIKTKPSSINFVKVYMYDNYINVSPNYTHNDITSFNISIPGDIKQQIKNEFPTLGDMFVTDGYSNSRLQIRNPMLIRNDSIKTETCNLLSKMTVIPNPRNPQRFVTDSNPQRFVTDSDY